MAKFIKFETSHCPMCKAMDVLLKQLGVEVIHIDAEERPETAEEFGIRSVPTLVRLNEKNVEVARTCFCSIEELKSFCK